MTEFRRLQIPEVIEVVPPKFGDHRGFFSEVFKRSAFEAEGIAIDWVQDNQSFSAEAGTVRGLHFQASPFAQAKLIRVLRGAIYDVAVDIRKGSPTYGRWVAAELSAEKWNQLLIPTGFAHGFMTLTSDVEVIYKVSAPYSRESEGAIRWDDPDLAIAWPRAGEAILSEKDAAAPLLADFISPFAYEAA
ncbi:MAG: dTDP-4-dehydrorhamnose 3,5-epimerase [Sphingomonas sp.]|uniref:dTDP-4-dehydrorhamnose 3,5-epimerase n=1 Tax=Sphingomonas sp. TaxID=28214 RepID=UPI001B02A8DA|nr:dTDP-4-dehydrorhamnose 3,5-epimerase [Sphingomonas sp.]MBO9622467.1 dTDP-4-dehydrorhamnose 3,5-epimerase [Sphingomonas sp.]